MRKLIKKFVKEIISDGDVINLSKFKKDKRDKEDYYNEILVSKDGSFVFNPDDYVFVVLDHQDQADALVDGNLNLAEELGAVVTELSAKNMEKE